MAELTKAHVKGYTRKDGTFVKPHQRAGDVEAVEHPRKNDRGQSVTIHHPHRASSKAAWSDPEQAATFVPDGDVPLSLNGVPLTPWRDYPRTVEGWDYVGGVNHELDEPPLPDTGGKYLAAGVIIEEPDGRVWIVHPTNAYGGYQATWPKGGHDDRISLQATAIKEAFEESGLRVQITGIVGDFERTTSVARFYRAVRAGGSPAHAGWETQAVTLCPKDELYNYLNMNADHAIIDKLFGVK